MTIIEELEKLCKQCTLVDELIIARTIEALQGAREALESCHDYEDNIRDTHHYSQVRQMHNKFKVKSALRLLNE